MIKSQLQKLNFDRYDELQQALSQCPSEEADNLIDPSDVYKVCVGVGLPLNNDLLTALIQKSVSYEITEDLGQHEIFLDESYH